MTTDPQSAAVEFCIGAAAAIVAGVKQLDLTRLTVSELYAVIAAASAGVLTGTGPHDLKIRQTFVSAMADIFRTEREAKLSTKDLALQARALAHHLKSLSNQDDDQ